MARTFYRIVQTDPPTPHDLLSNQAKGRIAVGTLTAKRQEQWNGLSVFATEAQAKRRARDRPRLGAFVTEREVPDDGSIRYERTSPGTPGHCTLGGTPQAFLGAS